MRKRQGARARVVSLILRELEMMEFYLKVGDEVIQDRQVSAAAIAAFADVSGDRSPNHVDDDEMSKSAYGGRIAHGALLVAFMSACSTEIVERTPNVRSTETPISLGYDRIRFLKPVYVGDKVRLCYTVKEIDATRRRARSEIVIVNQKNETVCVGEHILKWVG
jgi:3-hydroxybutyryl-CoA dehydratase